MVFLQYPPIGFWLVVPVCFTAASALQPPSTRSRMVARSSEPRHSDATFQRPTSRFFFREAAAATEATSPPCSSLGIEDETPPKNMRWWVHSAVLRIFFLHKNKFDFLCGFPFTFTKSVSDHNSSDLLLNEFRNENEADLSYLQHYCKCNQETMSDESRLESSLKLFLKLVSKKSFFKKWLELNSGEKDVICLTLHLVRKTSLSVVAFSIEHFGNFVCGCFWRPSYQNII